MDSQGGATVVAVDAGVLLDAGVVTRCRRRVHWDADPAADVPRTAPDPGVEQRIADAATHRRTVADGLAGRLGADWHEVPVGLPAAERGRRTAELLAAGARYVWGGLLPVDRVGGRRGGVELLVRTATGYVPVLVARHKVSDPGAGARTSPVTELDPAAARVDPARRPRPQPRDQMRLVHAVRMLRAAGLAGGRATGGVIGLDADVVVWHDLDAATWPGGRSAMAEYDVRFADRRAVATAAATGAPALAQPSRVTECRTCPWWAVCGPALRAARDVSLVVRGEDAMVLRAAGVTTVDDLAARDPVAGLPVPLAGTSRSDAVLLARAWQRDLPLVRRRRETSVPRADVEVDVDMESFGDDGAYLWGCLLGGADVGLAPGYRAFATWQPVPTRDEGRSFGEFWGWLTGVRARAAAQGRTFRAYCYNELAENHWMLSSAQRFAGMAGMPAVAAVQEFIASPQWVDLFTVVSTEFLCPHGKGLKTVAPAAGFAWHDPEAGGENSMRWYRDAVGLDGSPPDPAQRERLLVYNADDVRATAALRSWIDSPAVQDVPVAADLLPRAGGPAEPSATMASDKLLDRDGGQLMRDRNGVPERRGVDWATAGVRVVPPDGLDPNTVQTPGMARAAAVTASTGATGLWAGTVTIEPGARTGAHHHGELESVIYVVSGRARMRWGDRLEHVAEAGPGAFIFVPPFVPHQEINASGDEPLHCVLTRSGQEPVVVNLDVDAVEDPQQVRWADPLHRP